MRNRIWYLPSNISADPGTATQAGEDRLVELSRTNPAASAGQLTITVSPACSTVSNGGEIMLNGSEYPRWPSPSSAIRTMFEASSETTTEPVHTPCAKLLETLGLRWTPFVVPIVKLLETVAWTPF